MDASADAAAGDGAFLDGLTEAERAALEREGVPRRFARGTALFHERQPSDKVVILRDGRVKLTCVTEEGREILLAVRGPGDLLGELSAIDGEPRSATAQALEAVDALVISREAFTGFLESNPRVAVVIMQMLARRLRDADRKRVEFAAQDSVGRVAARLVELVERFGEDAGDGAVRITLPLSQDELAGWVGASREAVSKALQALRGLGWIETHRRGVTVLDVDALRRRGS
ncbi:MAG TPA: Crp/Fnr family transcriptional regulator [Thermoleophilaceae bacterium]|nr:Crp/Fnr family transcriptional regulator [Thermoleophilaceae bacterium]